MALEILFKLLDHPSWCKFAKLWRLLQICIQQVETSNAFLSEMWALRAKTWEEYIFTSPDISPEADAVKTLLESVPCLQDAEMPSEEDNFILEVIPLKPSN